MRLFILSSTTCMLLVACKPAPESSYCPNTYKCDKLNANIKFEGYKIQETDTIMLTTYIKDGTFTHAVDSTFYYSNGPTYVRLISSDYDYDIFVPAVNRRYKMSNIVHSADSTVFYTACAGNGKTAPFPGCSYYPASADIDGVPVELEKYTSANFILVK